jgi:hypothetical protein
VLAMHRDLLQQVPHHDLFLKSNEFSTYSMS